MKVDLNVVKDTIPEDAATGIVYLSFTDLFKIKQKGLEEMLLEGKEVYLLSKQIPPIRLVLAQLK